jgi:hypothetical protein
MRGAFNFSLVSESLGLALNYSFGTFALSLVDTSNGGLLPPIVVFRGFYPDD